MLTELSETGSAKERAWADHGLALFSHGGPLRGGARKGFACASGNPDLPNPPSGLAWLAGVQGHDEEALLYTRRTPALLGGKGGVGAVAGDDPLSARSL